MKILNTYENPSPVLEKFLRYIAVDTQSDETTGTHPSTEKQRTLGRMLAEELRAMHADQVVYDEAYNYVYAAIPATVEKDEVVGFISHMDTAPDTSGTDVRPHFVYDYDGSEIPLGPSKRGSGDAPLVLSPDQFPELLGYKGQTLVTTDGATLLGADDKAGVAEIMAMAEVLLTDIETSKTTGAEPKYRHGRIAVAFTPDEEIGEGSDFFDLKQFGADVAYTVDGGALGELEYETFNAASATVTVKGVTVHPGEAKGKMVNAASIAAQFHCTLPADEVPEKTEGREGFYYLTDLSGETEEATLSYIIRDHDRSIFEARKQKLKDLEAQFCAIYGKGVVTVELSDQYYNMREKIEPDYLYLVDRAKASMEELGITPRVQPIRGGTDGARLSFEGLPCPNLCAGGHNFHGRFEYVPVESLERIAELLLHIACK